MKITIKTKVSMPFAEILDRIQKTIPQNAMPKLGMPDFIFVDEVEHAVAEFEMIFGKNTFSKQCKKLFQKENVWAMAVMPIFSAGTVFVCMKEREKRVRRLPFEFVMFHEIGHCFLANGGMHKDPQTVVDSSHEFLADAYAAAMTLLYMKNNFEGIFPFSDEWKEHFKNATKEGINEDNCIKYAISMMKQDGVPNGK